jgi:exonuclease III
MRILSLNIWRGKLHDPLIAFLKREAPATDVFCFQEVVNVLAATGSAANISDSSDLSKPALTEDIYSAIVKALPDFQGFFEAAQDEGNGVEMGLAIFVKKTDDVEKEGDAFVYRTRDAEVGVDGKTLGKNVQFVEVMKDGKEYAIANFHGLWTGDGREDTPERIEQSKKVKAFLAELVGAKIICGDFNLTLDTQSLAILEEGMKDLIREFNITSTRNHFFPYPDKYCDYMIVDKNITVNDFTVMPDEVSDHLAMRVDCLA